MTKTLNEIIDRYILESETIIKNANHEEAKAMITRIYSSFGEINQGLFSYIPDGTNPLPRLKLLRDKLEVYAAHAEYELLKCNPQSQTFINQHSNQSNLQNTDISISISFDQAISWANSEFSSDDKLRDEIIQKIKEIEAASLSSANKTSKWERLKPILQWVLDNGVEFVRLIPLILQTINLGSSWRQPEGGLLLY